MIRAGEENKCLICGGKGILRYFTKFQISPILLIYAKLVESAVPSFVVSPCGVMG